MRSHIMAKGGNNRRVSKRLMITDDDPSSSSVHQVLFNDDLLIEILLRIHVISLFYCKSVSKRWLSLITSPAFFNLRMTRFPNVHPPSGLFLQETDITGDHFEHDFVSWDRRIPLPGKKKKLSAFTFGCFGSDASNVEVLQSCNGLVLCVIRTNPAHKIYVYNPSINVFKRLPQVYGLKTNRIFDQMRLAFDPAKSPHYKVVHTRHLFHHDRHRYSIQTRIYSSETGRWRIGDTYSMEWFWWGFDTGVYWNDAIHWLDLTNRVRHFKLDVEHPHCTTTELPNNLDRNSHKGLFESCGCVLLACAGGLHHKHLEIYEMGNGYSGWSIRYIVDIDGSSTAAFLKTWKMSTVGFRFEFLHIVVGERQEESFVVMKLYGKVVKYNLLSKTLHMLCDTDINFTKSQTFPFIASFTGV